MVKKGFGFHTYQSNQFHTQRVYRILYTSTKTSNFNNFEHTHRPKKKQSVP